MKLGEYLDKKKLTLAQMSERTGLSAPYLSRLNTGVLPASRNAIIAIHKATKGKVSFKDLVDLEENKEVVA